MRIALLLTLIALYSPAVRADDVAKQETQLHQEESAMNKESVPSDSARVNALAQQYGVEPSRVEQLHARQPGWGGTAIELSLAQNLVKTDPKTYPTMNDALAKVEALRVDGKGYGAIAHELGFKLGPVISDAKHTRNQMRHEVTQAPPPAGHVQPTPYEKPPHPEKMSKPEKPAHPEKMGKPEKPPHP